MTVQVDNDKIENTSQTPVNQHRLNQNQSATTKKQMSIKDHEDGGSKFNSS